MWTRFYDMCSGGFEKTNYSVILIELPQKEAEEYFIKKYDRYPDNITCPCCGPDYSVSEYEDMPIVRSDEITLVISKSDM